MIVNRDPGDESDFFPEPDCQLPPRIDVPPGRFELTDEDIAELPIIDLGEWENEGGA